MLIWGINYLKGIDIFSRHKEFITVYYDVDGLVKSDAIVLNGLQIGQVSDISFHPDKSGKLVVTLRVQNKYFVSKKTEARIVSSSLFGGKSVEIFLHGDTVPAENGDTLFATVALSLRKEVNQQVGPIKEKTETLLTSLDSVVLMLQEIFNPYNRKHLTMTVENLSAAMKNIERSSQSLNELLAANNGRLRLLIENMESVSSNLKENNEEIDHIINNFSQISDSLAKANIAQTFSNASIALKQTSAVMEKINKREGSLGLLVNDDSLYNNLNAAARDLDKLILDIKANPKRYIHFSVFGKKGN